MIALRLYQPLLQDRIKVKAIPFLILFILGSQTIFAKELTESQSESKKHFSGLADYYADKFHGRKTASGAIHDRSKLTAAHRTLPFGTHLKVVNRRNGKSCTVIVNDRGPFTARKVVDLSHEAAKRLDFLSAGSVPVDCYIVLSKDAHIDKSISTKKLDDKLTELESAAQ